MRLEALFRGHENPPRPWSKPWRRCHAHKEGGHCLEEELPPEIELWGGLRRRAFGSSPPPSAEDPVVLISCTGSATRRDDNELELFRRRDACSW
jgi:hypothetical protein